ncbi:Large ribosomal subunit protein eL6 [Entamoeba marina]
MSGKAPQWFVPVKAGDAKVPSYYPTDDMIQESKLKKTVKGAKHTALDKPAWNLEKLRKSLVPGTIVIILNGKYAGKRVNGVPLLRINQRYVIATSQKIDVSKVDMSGVDVKFFKKVVMRKPAFGKEVSEEDLKKQREEKKALAVEKQKQVDATLIEEVKKVPMMKEYMQSYFGLKKGEFPHLLKF